MRCSMLVLAMLMAQPAMGASDEVLTSTVPVLAVLPLQGPASVRGALPKLDDELTSALQRLEIYDVTGPYELSTILASNVPVDRCKTMSCFVSIGTSVAAGQVLHGEVKPRGKDLELSVRIIDVEKKDVLHRASFEVSQNATLQRRDVMRGVRSMLGLRVLKERRSEISFRGRNLDAEYKKLRRYVLDNRRDAQRRIAVIDAFLEAYGDAEGERIVAAVAARRVLASGRDKLRPMDDVACSASSDCETRGLCRGSDLGCVAKKSDDCKPTYGCKLRGECAAENGACVASYGYDCEASRECKLKGKCMARAGMCVVGADVHCRHASVCERGGACSAVNGACITSSHARR